MAIRPVSSSIPMRSASKPDRVKIPFAQVGGLTPAALEGDFIAKYRLTGSDVRRYAKGWQVTVLQGSTGLLGIAYKGEKLPTLLGGSPNAVTQRDILHALLNREVPGLVPATPGGIQLYTAADLLDGTV